MLDAPIVNPPQFDVGPFVVGDMVNVVNGDTIVGPYCEWPRRISRCFIVTSIQQGKPK